jgi:ABC-type glycerol-3-phosphate transport system substrate-binding protein
MKTNFGVGGWGISSKSSNKQLAWEFILELVSKESMAQMAGFGNAIPARESTANLPTFLEHPKNSKIFYESIYASEPTPSPKSQVKFESIFNRCQQLIMTGSMPIEEALNEAHQNLELIFERDLMKENFLKKNKKN